MRTEIGNVSTLFIENKLVLCLREVKFCKVLSTIELNAYIIDSWYRVSHTLDSFIWKTHVYTNSHITILFRDCYDLLDPRRGLIVWYSLNHILFLEFFESCLHLVSNMVWSFVVAGLVGLQFCLYRV